MISAASPASTPAGRPSAKRLSDGAERLRISSMSASANAFSSASPSSRR